jgi:Lustrin, cysteine-rich repeated domain
MDVRKRCFSLTMRNSWRDKIGVATLEWTGVLKRVGAHNFKLSIVSAQIGNKPFFAMKLTSCTLTSILTLVFCCLGNHECDAQQGPTTKCPSNQQYLPAVQYGCPASCDQPIPLCKAAIGPGCGCPKGTVVAGSTRPHNPFLCLPPRRCRKLPLPVCPNGSPLHDTISGARHFCGRGGKPCPRGYICHTDPADRFAVCCPDPPPKNDCLVSGCNREICAAEQLVSICLVPTCKVACLKFATCQRNPSGVCGWETNTRAYHTCVDKCRTKQAHI